jgi:platelet-activating factor acetylhydrolase IB subunit alpha
MDLEAHLSKAIEEISHFSAGSAKLSDKEWLPAEPAKSTFIGHHDKINAVSFHPSYSVLASASVDATVKLGYRRARTHAQEPHEIGQGL